MAERRMFAKSVILFGAFLELSRSAQVLYILLNMQADDDGLVGNTMPQLRMARCTKRHLQELIDAGLLLEFPSGPVVIVHWLIHNQIRKDRYKPTVLQEEYMQLTKTENGSYRILEERLSSGCQKGSLPEPQGRIGEESPGKPSKAKHREGEVIGCNQSWLPPMKSSSFTDFEKRVLETYNKYCKGMVECRYLDEGLRKKLENLKELGWTEVAMEEALRIAGECAFLRGENKDGWVCSLEWLCSDENLRKVCAGKYQTYQKKEKVPYGATGELGQAELEAIQKLLRKEG